MNSNQIGDVSVGKVMAAFLSKGFTVSVPIATGCPYDLIVDDGTRLWRVQVKTGRSIKGSLHVEGRSNNGRWYRKAESRSYQGKVDAFAAFSRETGQCFFIPIEVMARAGLRLRIDPPKNNQTKGVKWARDYLL